MKILQVIASMDPATGGTSQGIRNSVEAMKIHNISNDVVSLDPPDAPFIANDDFKIYALGTSKNPWAYSGKLMAWLRSNMENYDCVIVNGLWLYPSIAVKRAMAKITPKKRPKWYVMPHGMLDPYFQNAPDRKLKAIRNRIYWKWIERKVIESADAVLFTTDEEKNLARDTFFPYRPKQTHTIGYGIQQPPVIKPEMKTAYIESVGLKPEDSFLLFISRIHPKKGVDILVDAYAKMLVKRAEEKTFPKLVIAGPGLESEFGKKIVNRVGSSSKLKENVFFPGMLSGDAKWGAFYHADAFMLPSHQENFGIAVAESLACSTPVLISDKVNIWREIQNAGGGIVKPDTTEGITELLSEWVKLDQEEKTEMSGAAFTTYSRHFEINVVIEKLLNVLSGTFVSESESA